MFNHKLHTKSTTIAVYEIETSDDNNNGNILITYSNANNVNLLTVDVRRDKMLAINFNYDNETKGKLKFRMQLQLGGTMLASWSDPTKNTGITFEPSVEGINNFLAIIYNFHSIVSNVINDLPPELFKPTLAAKSKDFLSNLYQYLSKFVTNDLVGNTRIVSELHLVFRDEIRKLEGLKTLTEKPSNQIHQLAPK